MGLCDGLDDDCDDAIDEDLVHPPCELTLGVCKDSTQLCGGSSGFVPCAPARYGDDHEPSELSCDLSLIHI